MMRVLRPLAVVAVIASLGPAEAAPDPSGGAGIDMLAPINGWRHSADDESRYTQEVHYPAVTVATPPGQGSAALIAGRVRNQPKAGSRSGRDLVGTLVVNGVAMPQRIESDGSFSRPYAFANGSNSVELRTAQGGSRRVQFYDSYGGKPRPRLRIVLSWDTDATDLDLHVVSPDGEHVWYGHRVAANGGALDVDVTTGYGPEIYSTPAPVAGTYLVYANYYGSGSDHSVITTARVTVVNDENTPAERQQTFWVPMRKAGELTLVHRFAVK